MPRISRKLKAVNVWARARFAPNMRSIQGILALGCAGLRNRVIWAPRCSWSGGIALLAVGAPPLTRQSEPAASREHERFQAANHGQSRVPVRSHGAASTESAVNSLRAERRRRRANAQRAVATCDNAATATCGCLGGSRPVELIDCSQVLVGEVFACGGKALEDGVQQWHRGSGALLDLAHEL